MNIRDAIAHAEAVAEKEGCSECGEQHRKLAAWLREAEKDAARLDFLERSRLETDSAGDWNEEPTFGVHRVSGVRNDREWHCLGRGETLRAAIDTAMQSPKGGA